MTITSAANVNEILNRTAAEVGLEPVTDPFGDTSQHFTQMRFLLQTVGEELALAHPWEFLVREEQILTLDTDTGIYPLPDDFMYMLDQTGWERKENVPLFGPLSAQDWTYLLGRDLVTFTIYASFRIKDGTFNIFPAPPPSGLDINYEYQSKNWVQNPNDLTEFTDTFTSGDDIILYDRTLTTRYLKVKWLGAKGFDTTKPQEDFNQMFSFLTGKDKGGDIISAGKNGRQFPYLDARYNTPDTGFGSV